MATVSSASASQTTGYGPGSVAVQLSSSNGNLAEIVRALDAEVVVRHTRNSSIHERR